MIVGVTRAGSRFHCGDDNEGTPQTWNHSSKSTVNALTAVRRVGARAVSPRAVVMRERRADGRARTPRSS